MRGVKMDRNLGRSQADAHAVNRRPSLMSQVSTVLSSWSHVTLNKSRSAAQMVGSYLGVTDSPDLNNLNLWKDRLLTRAKSGELGLKLPVWKTSNTRKEDAIKHLDEVLDQISSRQSLRKLDSELDCQMSDYQIHFDNECISPSTSSEGSEQRYAMEICHSDEQTHHEHQSDMFHRKRHTSLQRETHGNTTPSNERRESNTYSDSFRCHHSIANKTSVTNSKDDSNSVQMEYGNITHEMYSPRRSKSAHLRAEFFADMYVSAAPSNSQKLDPFISIEDISTIQSTIDIDRNETAKAEIKLTHDEEHISDVGVTDSHQVQGGNYMKERWSYKSGVANPYGWLAADVSTDPPGDMIELEGMPNIDSICDLTSTSDILASSASPSVSSIEGSSSEPVLNQPIVDEIKRGEPDKLSKHPIICTASDPDPANGVVPGQIKTEWLKLVEDDESMICRGHSAASYQLRNRSSILKSSASTTTRPGSVTFSPQVTEHYQKLGMTVSELKTTPSYEDELSQNKNLHHPMLATGEKLLYGEEALQHYQQFAQREQQIKLENLYERKEDMKAELLDDLHELKAAMKMLQADLPEPSTEPVSVCQRLRERFSLPGSSCGCCKKQELPRSGSEENAAGRSQSKLPQYRVWLIYVISLLQIIFFTIIGVIEGVSNLGLEPTLVLGRNIRTFRGRETFEHWVLPNIWVGPDPYALIHYGAVFAPCMRDDVSIMLDYARQGYNINAKLGCCEISLRNTAGTTTQDECQEKTGGIGTWRSDVMCGDRHWSQRTVTQNLWPCCYGLRAQCILASVDHCDLLQGVLHYDLDHCTQVNCRSSLCGMGGLSADTTLPYMPSNANQQWRLLLGVFLHQGVVSLILVIFLQLLIGRQIEELAGWFRLMIIYLLSGIMSLLIGGVFSPYLPHCGGGGAAFSLLGVLLVELLQSWHHVKRPCWELTKLMIVFLLAVLSGTLPYVDTFELIGGLLCGILTGIILLPYVTFGRWQAVRRRVLLLVTLPVIVLFLFFALYLFYDIQTVDQACKACQLINCVPYTDTMCNITRLT